MAAFIYDEVKEALDMRKYSNETDEAYWRRRSTQLLDMVLGFGMLPPEIKEFVEIPPDNILGAGFKIGHNVSKWEPEDEN